MERERERKGKETLQGREVKEEGNEGKNMEGKEKRKKIK